MAPQKSIQPIATMAAAAPKRLQVVTHVLAARKKTSQMIMSVTQMSGEILFWVLPYVMAASETWDLPLPSQTPFIQPEAVAKLRVVPHVLAVRKNISQLRISFADISGELFSRVLSFVPEARDTLEPPSPSDMIYYFLCHFSSSLFLLSIFWNQNILR